LVSTLVFDIPVQGTFHISASYCEPEVHIPSRVDTLQLLVHGATYTRNYVSVPFLYLPLLFRSSKVAYLEA
jgi:hypothetical protein